MTRALGGWALLAAMSVGAVCRPAYLKQRENGIPWKSQFKVGGAYPLPWYGIQIGGAG